MPRYRVVFERPEIVIEADSVVDGLAAGWDFVCDIHHPIDFIEEIPNG